MVLSFAISALGIILASVYENYESFSVIMNFIVMPMFFLSGAMYPVKLMPVTLQMFTKINPLTFGIDALKHLIFPFATGRMGADFPFLLDLAMIIGSSLLFVAIGGRAFERKG
jgi:ABC-2 type transport system permease protein